MGDLWMETNSENKIIQMRTVKAPFSAPQHFQESVRELVKKCCEGNLSYLGNGLYLYKG